MSSRRGAGQGSPPSCRHGWWVGPQPSHQAPKAHRVPLRPALTHTPPHPVQLALQAAHAPGAHGDRMGRSWVTGGSGSSGLPLCLPSELRSLRCSPAFPVLGSQQDGVRVNGGPGLRAGLGEPRVLGDSLELVAQARSRPAAWAPGRQGLEWRPRASPWQQGVRVKGHQLRVPGLPLTSGQSLPALHAASAPFHLPSLLGFPKPLSEGQT